MIKALKSWSAAIGTIGGIALATVFSSIAPVLALPAEQVSSALGPTPVFFIVSNDNKILFIDQKEQNQKIAPRFLSQQDAQQFLQKLQQSNPQVANGARIAVLPLAQAYNIDGDVSSQREIQFEYVPIQQQFQNARSMTQEFVGVPLFYATVGQDSITLEENGKTVVPFFFEREALQQMVDRFKQAQPNRASEIQFKVVALEALIETLKTSNDNNLSRITLVPSQDSIAFIRSIQQQAQQQNQQNQQNPQNRR
ncbi:Tic22 family protein [Oscillatoria sp. FACHB-1406]|uniref:Tic22 family protein n=1 Tax=Oscillatoria sp. FACHB-1406 TaxID=2692846 RepID=UPI00168263F5|nr:Tic22 family protein [Oscillatoria sp. FACHB-1406]MBD2579500.1 hypothetical protein [Oscillatoria sp. FACHB-1406]